MTVGHNYRLLLSEHPIPATDDLKVDMELRSLSSTALMLLICLTYPATHATTTGCSLELFDGYGGSQEDAILGPIPLATDSESEAVKFSTGGTDIDLLTVPTGQENPVEVCTSLAINLTETATHLRLLFENLDADNDCTLSIHASW